MNCFQVSSFEAHIKKHMISEYEVNNNNKHFTIIENIVYKLHNAKGSNNSYQCKSPLSPFLAVMSGYLRIVHGTVISHIKRSLNTKSFQLLIKMSQ